MSKTKILYTIESLDIGGKENQLIKLAKGLADRKNFQVKIVLLKSNVEVNFERLKGLDITILKKQKGIFYIYDLFRIIKNYDPTIIHCWENKSLIVLYFLKYFMDFKLIDGSVRYAVKRKLINKQNILSKIAFLFSDFIIANSHEGLEASGLGQCKKAKVIHNGIQNNNLSFKGNSNKIYDLVCVANFLPSKDHITLIKVVISLIKSGIDIKLLLIGDGILLSTLKGMVPIDIKDKIYFLGRIDNVDHYLQYCKIGILLSNAQIAAEGISNSILEYMNAGLPVIATNNGGNKEVIKDSLNGYLIDPFDKFQLAINILKLLNNPKLLNEMGAHSKSIIKEKFLEERMIANYVNFYNYLL